MPNDSATVQWLTPLEYFKTIELSQDWAANHISQFIKSALPVWFGHLPAVAISNGINRRLPLGYGHPRALCYQ